MVNLKFRGGSLRAPVCILPGQADDCVTIHLGYGRTRAGSVGNGVGFNANALRTSDAPWGGAGLGDRKDRRASRPGHDAASLGNGRPRVGPRRHARGISERPHAPAKSNEPPPRDDETLYPAVAYTGHAWGMVIDLNTCTGCGVCTIACQAENNIPVVGKEQVAMGREMHWIRVDRYFEGEAAKSARAASTGAVHALRERALRARLPGRGHGAQQRGAQPDGLQPLHRHALLLEQLPLQSAPVQFPRIRREPVRAAGHAQAHAQSGRQRAQPRRDGEMHLLHPARSTR